MSVLLVKYFSSGHGKLLFWGSATWIGPILSVLSQILGLVLQALFTYAIPVLVMTDKKFFGAIIGSFKFFARHIGLTLLLVGLPMLISIPLIILNYNGPYLMVTFLPEIILWLGVLGIVVNSLLIDPLITLTTAAYYAHENPGVKSK
jgi:hypothetical protein